MSPKSVEPLPSTSPSGVPQEDDKAARMSPKSTLPLSSRSSDKRVAVVGRQRTQESHGWR